MNTFDTKIITHSHIILNRDDILSVTAPSSEGVITLLPKHECVLELLKEGVLTVKYGNEEEMIAIGGGYLETDGKKMTILVSKAYHQNEINEKLVEKALADAQNIIQETKDAKERQIAIETIQRSKLQLKVVKKRKQHA